MVELRTHSSRVGESPYSQIYLYLPALALIPSIPMKVSSRKRYYTITEAAKELGVTRAAVHRAIKQGRLEAERGELSN